MSTNDQLAFDSVWTYIKNLMSTDGDNPGFILDRKTRADYLKHIYGQIEEILPDLSVSGLGLLLHAAPLKAKTALYKKWALGSDLSGYRLEEISEVMRAAPMEAGDVILQKWAKAAQIGYYSAKDIVQVLSGFPIDIQRGIMGVWVKGADIQAMTQAELRWLERNAPPAVIVVIREARSMSRHHTQQ